MDVELSEVRDFLARHAPFDVLPGEVLDGIPRQCTLRYARRGTVVLEVGQQGEGLYVVRSGAVDVVDESGTLIERVDTGSAFGMSSLLERRPTRFRCVATEDSLLVVLPTQLFESLAREHTAFVTFYTATHRDRLTKAIANLQRATSGTTVLGTVVGELVAREPVTTEAGASVADAAAAMSRAGVSSLLVVDGTGLCGIVTDRDLRNRVLAVRLDPGRPVREVMTAPALTMRSDAMAFEALLEMVSRGIHHLPVVGGHGELIGMITTTDLVRLGNSDPVVLAADIGRQRTLAGVVELAGRIPPALAELVDRDVSAADIGRVTTALGDAVRRRVVALVEEELGSTDTLEMCGWTAVSRGHDGHQFVAEGGVCDLVRMGPARRRVPRATTAVPCSRGGRRACSASWWRPRMIPLARPAIAKSDCIASTARPTLSSVSARRASRPVTTSTIRADGSTMISTLLSGEANAECSLVSEPASVTLRRPDENGKPVSRDSPRVPNRAIDVLHPCV